MIYDHIDICTYESDAKYESKVLNRSGTIFK